MAEVQPPTTAHEHKPRKSVSFDPTSTVVDEFGDVTEETNGQAAAQKTSAEAHANETENGESNEKDKDADVDDAAAMFEGMKLKKKKKSKTPKDGEGKDAAADGGDVDLSAMKKKKKKKAKPAADGDDFDAKLAQAGVDDAAGDEDADNAVDDDEDEGDMETGTGIWAHDDKRPLSYKMLLDRIYVKLLEKNPDAASAGGKSIKIPPPQCLREGNKKTIFANISEIAKRLKRTDEHVIQYLFAELGTNGSVDGSKRLVIKGRFQAKQIEQVLRNYIREYVTCKTCKSVDTELNKGENRLYFVTCNSCNSRRSVQAIKAGFSAQVGKRKRQQA